MAKEICKQQYHTKEERVIFYSVKGTCSDNIMPLYGCCPKIIILVLCVINVYSLSFPIACYTLCEYRYRYMFARECRYTILRARASICVVCGRVYVDIELI